MSGKMWFIYSRVSSDEQARHGGSLEAQRDSCRNLAAAHQLPLGADVEDAGISGSTLNRPGIQSLLEKAEEGVLGGVIVWKLDRLTRSLRDLLALMERFSELGVGVISVQERLDTNSPMGRFALHLLGALAQLEREQVSERIRFVQAHKRSQNAYVGGTIATGLATIQDGRNRKLVVNEMYGPAISKCWSLVIKGASLKEVAQYLDVSKVPTRGGKPWTKNSAGQLLSNARYVGLLIDEETFNLAASILGLRFSPRTAKLGVKPTATAHERPTDRVWRFQGVTSCAKCGMALVGSQSMGSRGVWYAYLRCSGRQKRIGGCDAPDLPATQVEDLAIAALVRGIEAGRITDVLGREQAVRQLSVAPLWKARGEIQLKQDEIQRKVDSLLDLVTEGATAAKAVAPRLVGLQQELDRLGVEAAQLDDRLAAATISDGDVQKVEDTLKVGLARLAEQPWDEQKAIVAGLVKKLKIAVGLPFTIEVGVPLAQVRTDVKEWCVI
jgi:site-specific DNA recombinase